MNFGRRVAKIGKANTRKAATKIKMKYGAEPMKIFFNVAVGSGTDPLTV